MATDSFFDSNKSTGAESQITSWLNEIAFVDNNAKTTLLKKIQETIIHQAPHLLPKYLDDILANVTDRSQEVRKAIVGFIEEVCKLRIDLLPNMITQLRMLLLDEVVPVQKRVIQAANIVYKNAVMWICTSEETTTEMKNTWELLNELKLSILNMVDSENEGIRTNSIKFLEGIIVLQTYPDENSEKKPGDFSLDDVPLTLRFARRSTLEDESNHIFNLLLKFHNSQHISGVNLMACMTALCQVAKARSSYMPQVIQALTELHTTLPPTLTQSQVNSVRKHLKLQVFNLVKHPASADMLPHLAQLLSDLGMSSQEISKVIPREKRNKRVSSLKNGEGLAKRARIDSPQSNSQDSNKSDASSYPESMIEDVAVPDNQLSTLTEKIIQDSLQNIELVIKLVTATMEYLPDEMPSDFTTLYEHISKSGVILQTPILAKLLFTLIKPAEPESKSTFTAPEPKAEEEKANLKSALAKLESNRKIDIAVNKLIEDTKNTSAEIEAAREKEIMKNINREKLICPPTPTVPKLKQRLTTIKLQEVTKPLPKDVKERLMTGAVERILKAERSSLEGGILGVREKMLTIFAVSCGSQIRETILTYIMDDIPKQIDLALSWLFEEYSFVQGFNRSIVGSNTPKMQERFGNNYNNLMCALVTNISELNDPSQEVIREKLLRRVYLEAPVVTEDAIVFLKHMCSESDKTMLGLNLLRDLIFFQPPKATKYISVILPLTIHENTEMREAAVEQVLQLYDHKNESLKKAIEKHAMLYLGFIALPQPPNDLFGIENGRPEDIRIWTEDLYKVCLQLYLALLSVNEELISELWRAYAGAGAEGKRCALRLIEGPVRKLGPDCPALLSLVEECPKGAETLVTRVIHILTEKIAPTRELVSRVRELYAKRVSDVRFLIPVINGLTKAEVLGALPKLIKLNPVVVREVFSKMLGSQTPPEEQYSLPVSPAELLVALHLIDPAKVELKFIVKATSLCFAERHAYSYEVLSTVLHDLVEQPQLPVLLMRSVLQALTLHPARLTPLVIHILKSLITRRVWENKVVWEGFLKCCQRLKPQSLSVLVMLPEDAFKQALECCDDLRVALIKAAPNMPGIPRGIHKILEEIVAPVTAMAPNNIDVMGSGEPDAVSALNEPLPPGMD